MKKIFFLFLCFVSLYAKEESRFFMGFGGGYGAASKFSVTGPRLALGDETDTFMEIDFLKFEGMVGSEEIYSNTVSTRTYINAGYSFTHTLGKQKDFAKKLLSVIDASWNYDLILNFPLSKNFQLRFYAGMGVGVDYYDGVWVDFIKRLHTALQESDLQYTRFDKDFIFLRLTFNFGTQLLLAQHHILEFAITTFMTGDTNPTLLKFELPGDEMVSRFEFQPPIIFSSRYIYRF